MRKRKSKLLEFLKKHEWKIGYIGLILAVVGLFVQVVTYYYPSVIIQRD
jgi:hypothetical protein